MLASRSGWLNDAGVDHRNHDVGTGGLVPGRADVEPGVGGAEGPLLGQAAVVGGQRGVQHLVHFHALHVGVGGQLAHQGFGFGAIQRAVGLNQLRSHCQTTHAVQAQLLAGLGRQRTCSGAQRGRQHTGAAQGATAVLVGHDELLVGLRGGQATQVDITGKRRRCQQQRGKGRSTQDAERSVARTKRRVRHRIPFQSREPPKR